MCSCERLGDRGNRGSNTERRNTKKTSVGTCKWQHERKQAAAQRQLFSLGRSWRKDAE